MILSEFQYTDFGMMCFLNPLPSVIAPKFLTSVHLSLFCWNFFFSHMLMNLLQHEAGRANYEGAQRQIDEIKGKIETTISNVKDIQVELEKQKLEASEARKLEQVSHSLFFFFFIFLESLCSFLMGMWQLQTCVQEQDRLIPREQAARQKVAELLSTLESEKSQGSVLKAILQAKEANHIPGIYGRLGDLGAIDGEHLCLCCARKYKNVSFYKFMIS